ncbi:hypothetical protein DFH09DRAFT_1323737 [Mycena vulgaris]|nr:hypothetical protein DFH09DRAFT_1323737 [Mycena vulgaris]
MTRFFVYLPDDDGIRIIKLDSNTKVAEAIAFIIEEKLYGNRITWANSPSLYVASGLSGLPTDTLVARTKIWLSTKPAPMEDLINLNTYFPGGPLSRQNITIDIVITTQAKHRRTISFKAETTMRDNLVSYLYETTRERGFFFVRGTAGSGKPILCSLLHNFILAQDEHAIVAVMGVWREKNTVPDSLAASLQRGDLEDYNQIPDGQQMWLLFDEGQTTYADYKL